MIKKKKNKLELKNFVQNWKGNGGNLILVTHYVVILAVTGLAPSSGELVIVDKNFNVYQLLIHLIKYKINYCENY